MLNRNTWRWLLIAALSIVPLTSGASVIQPLSGQSIKFTPDLAAGEDFLYINPPNSAGISLNRFSAFDASEPIKLMNTPSYNPQTGAAISTSRLVIIVAPDIRLSSTIDIVGPGTDIIFISTSEAQDGSSYMSCDSCIFNNALRVSLITGHFDSLDYDIFELGSVKSRGQLSVKSLYAPGAIGLDLVSALIDVSGVVDINQSAIKSSSSGGFSAAPHGSYKLGSGSIEVVGGPFAWDYENRRLLTAYRNYSDYVIGGEFRAPRVSVSISGNLDFKGEIDTKVDALTVVSYRGRSHIPQEGVKIQALYIDENDQGVNVEFSGEIYSEGEVLFSATNDVDFGLQAKAKAKEVGVLAGGEFSNRSHIVGETINIAAAEIVNEGHLDAKQVVSSGDQAAVYKIQAWAEKDFANQYGGVITGESITLQSEAGIVRNGSRTPYRTDSINRAGFLDLNSSDILKNLTSMETAELSKLNSSELGAYYMLPAGVSLVRDMSLEMPQSHRAHIIGDSVIVHAQAFENINPYYTQKTIEETEVEINLGGDPWTVISKTANFIFDRQRVSQVMISAENLLEFGGMDGGRSEYVLNSSAVMLLNSPDGELKFKSKKVINNRYRVATFLWKVASRYSVEPLEDAGVNTAFSNAYRSEVAAYSSPAFITTMGGMEADATEYFANIMGYIEAYSGAKIKSPYLRNIGMKNNIWTPFEGLFAGLSCRTIGLFGPSQPIEGCEEPVIEYETFRQLELDTLFFVTGGTLDASSADGWFGVVNPFQYFVNQSLSPLYQEITSDLPSPHIFNWNTLGSYQQGTYYNNVRDISVDMAQLENVFGYADVEVTWKYDKHNYKEWSEYPGNPDEADNYHTVETLEGSGSFSLLSLIEDYYSKIRDKFTDFINEFDWWGLAE